VAKAMVVTASPVNIPVDSTTSRIRFFAFIVCYRQLILNKVYVKCERR
jgi:hypothetical protein